LSQELKGRVHVLKWPAIKDKDVKIEPRIYVLFVLDFSGECKFIESETFSVYRNIFLAATLVV